MAPIPPFSDCGLTRPKFPSILRPVYIVRLSTSLLRYLVSVVSVSFLDDLSVKVPTENIVPPPALPPPALPVSTILLKERRDYNNSFPSTAPSSLGAPSQFSQIQEKDKQKIAWSRPPEADSPIPVLLFHRIMREFVDNCNNHQPVDKDNLLVLNLTDAMSRFLQTDATRAANVHNILIKHGIPITTSTNDPEHPKSHDFLTDGAIDYGGHLISIFEVKNEITSTGAEPYAQVILNYHHSVSEKSTEHPRFNFPCLIVTAFGQTFTSSLVYNTNAMFSGAHIFSGAVRTSRPHFQVFTSIPLFCHKTDTNMRESLARHFGAFKKAISLLEECYETLENPALIEDLDPRFPDPRTYHSLETNSTVNFKYVGQMYAKRLLFLGKTDNGERVCIKFVRRYSREAHEKCATLGFGPKLRGFEGIGAGWTMVVMDDLSEEYEPFDKNALDADTHETDIRKGLNELHQAHFVHGDVRDANIMVRMDGDPGFMLVDFDWAGIIGEARYPANVNKVDFWRPDDVSDGMLIKAEHDMAMMNKIFHEDSLCSSAGESNL